MTEFIPPGRAQVRNRPSVKARRKQAYRKPAVWKPKVFKSEMYFINALREWMGLQALYGEEYKRT